MLSALAGLNRFLDNNPTNNDLFEGGWKEILLEYLKYCDRNL